MHLVDKLIVYACWLKAHSATNDFVITLANSVRNPKITLINSTGESFVPEMEMLNNHQFSVKRGLFPAGMYFVIIAAGEVIAGNERLILINK